MSTGESPGATSSLDRVRGVYSFWGEHAGLYALQDYVTFLGRPRRIRARAATALSVGEGARVLEVGCGTGRNFPFILQQVGPTGRLVGFDYSEEMLGDAAYIHPQLPARDAVDLCQGTACRLDWAAAEAWGGHLECSGTLVAGAAEQHAELPTPQVAAVQRVAGVHADSPVSSARSRPGRAVSRPSRTIRATIRAVMCTHLRQARA